MNKCYIRFGLFVRSYVCVHTYTREARASADGLKLTLTRESSPFHSVLVAHAHLDLGMHALERLTSAQLGDFNIKRTSIIGKLY